MFSWEGGQWMFADNANLLDGWDIRKVVQAGARYGADSGDLYACLFFFLREQYVEFAQRLARFKVKFILYSLPLPLLDRMLAPNTHVGALGEGFDRIELSNMADENYFGLESILQTLGNLLSEFNKDATLIVSLVNWVYRQRDAKVEGASEAVMEQTFWNAMKYVSQQHSKRPCRMMAHVYTV
jgi:hypothetical protein